MSEFQNKKVLIWGKTYPELSTRHKETVCTGGCDEEGHPIRLYPVPLRYLPDRQQYALYDWIDVPMVRQLKDPRPESYKVIPEKITKASHLDTNGGSWSDRRRVIFADRTWHYECLEDLKLAQKREMRSLGLVKVGSITKVELVERPASDYLAHKEKLRNLQGITDLFDYDQKDLEFFPYRVRVHWHCSQLRGAHPCPGHTASVLDWGLGELGRREGAQKALARMEQLADLDRYDLRLFLGNFFLHQRVFGIIGLWYPLKRNLHQQDLFESP